MSSAMESAAAAAVDSWATSDPYLPFKPLFAYSYATQLVLNGIILALLTVLLIHLLFTSQYHYPLARLNYILQVSGVAVTLTAVAATMLVILRVGALETNTWPYMTDFIYVDVPRPSWDEAQLIAWYCMEAISSAIVQITHIQFLTLLYPSALEARLIFGLLGPIALASAAMTFTGLSSGKTVQYGLILRNICNSTLSLLFTSALFLWGFYVNRRRAWRTDGGTAAFGAGALVLAVSSTAVNFLEVKVDRLSWLQHLLWSIILWQSWLGWWWWVGSGMGIGEVEDMMEKEHRRAKKIERRRRKQESKANARSERDRKQHQQHSDVGGGGGSASVNGSSTGTASATWAGLTRSLSASRRRNRSGTLTGGPHHQVSFQTMRGEDEGGGPSEGDGRSAPIELANLRKRTHEHGETIPDADRERDITLPHPVTSPRRGADGGGGGINIGDGSSGSGETGTPPAASSTGLSQSSSSISSCATISTLHMPRSFGQFVAFPVTLINHYVVRLGRAHDEAAKRKAEERRAAVVIASGDGWGLGAFGVREARDGQGRLREARRELRQGRLTAERSEGEEEVDGEVKDEDEEGEWVDEETTTRRAAGRRPPPLGTAPGSSRSGDNARRLGSRAALSRPVPSDSSDPRSGGWSWWGPLKKWRLQDRTQY